MRKFKEYIKNLFPNIDTTVIQPSFPDYFKPAKKPKNPNKINIKRGNFATNWK